ncbi:MAG: ectoine hydroxylase-related dioxygenase (phytanoyl-CoA dioxygenase family) [Saprospiraceae bacterium]|jgi:ectoine hydroxylase-related dioxygenase (phytanoyl-CoA dioxygenase family)
MIQLPTSAHQQFDQDGFLVVDKLIELSRVPALHQAFDDLFEGQFDTGVQPDEINWQQATGDPSLTRQICNAWKANRQIARTILDEDIGRAIAQLVGWGGVRIMIDNVIWKPKGAKSLGYHQDSSYLDWYTPSDLLTCWIALDQTTADGGTVEFVKGSHKWQRSVPEGEFHAPKNYRAPMSKAAQTEGLIPDIHYVEVPAGGGSFHHGWTWHGSGQNTSQRHRRALVLHAMRADAEYNPEKLQQGIGPIYSRYKHLADNQLDENYFPIIWRRDGYRTPQLSDYLGR